MATLAASAVLILAAAVVSAGAQRPTADRGRHLLLVPDEDKPALALQKSDARVVARYAAFSLVEAAGEDAERLRRAGAELRDDMRAVRIGARSLDPLVERGPLVSKGERPDGPGLAVVQ